ncbi:MAG: hypothetical protein AAB710_01485 [Patescibacteria group bacterium]
MIPYVVLMLCNQRGAETVEDLCSLTYNRLLMTRGMEAHMVDHICDTLKKMGKKLCDE